MEKKTATEPAFFRPFGQFVQSRYKGPLASILAAISDILLVLNLWFAVFLLQTDPFAVFLFLFVGISWLLLGHDLIRESAMPNNCRQFEARKQDSAFHYWGAMILFFLVFLIAPTVVSTSAVLKVFYGTAP